MAKDHTYSIDLDIHTPRASKQALKELQDALKESGNSIDELDKAYENIAEHTQDVITLNKQYNKVISDTLAAKDKEIAELEAEKVGIAAVRDLSERHKKQMIAAVDTQIKRLKTEQNIIKAKAKEVEIQKSLGQLIKGDLKGIKDKIKEQFKFIEALKTTEGRYNAIKHAASESAKAAAQIGSKVASVGAKTVGGAVAIGGALVGGAIASAGALADKDKALGALKSGVDPSIVDSVYIKTGADYNTIVAAINNLSSVTRDNALLVQGAVLEIQNPGIGKLLLSQSRMESGNISKLNTAITQIKKQTGIQDISNALTASTQSHTVARGAISQIEYIQAYSALSQAGLDEERINRIIRSVANKKGNFIDNLNKEDLSKYAHRQEKIQLQNQTLNLKRINTDKESEISTTQSVVEKIRQFELKKNELLVKMLPIVDKILTEVGKVIDSPVVDKIAQGLINLFATVIPLLEPVMKALMPILKLLAPVLEWLVNVTTDFVNTIVVPLVEGLGAIIEKIIPWSDGQPAVRAQGGLVTSPSICGESGPELVLPLDYSRTGRVGQIINNFNTTQSFNMQSNQQTPLAFSQAIGQNRYIKRYSGI